MRMRALFFLGVFAFALAALVPLRVGLGWLALDGRGLAAREARGTVWAGTLREARFGPAALGDVGTGMSPLPLLLGRARLEVERDGLGGAATVTRHGLGLDGLSGRIPVGTALAPLPVEALDLSGVTARFADGACREAEGLVRMRLGGSIGGVTLPAGASGTARCDGAALLLPLASQSGMEAIRLRIMADGRYRADVIVRPLDEAARARLVAAGFRRGAAGYSLRLEGSL